MDIYIKPIKNYNVAERKQLCIKDLADVVAEAGVKAKVDNILLPGVHSDCNAVYLISVTDMVKAIKAVYPDAHIINLGEQDTIVHFSAKKKRDNSVYEWLKIGFVALVLFFGAATAIMSFYMDAGIGKILENFYYLVFGTKSDKPLLVQIPYSLGIAIGIIVFFNHFAGRKIMEDPTPIEVEMSKYDTDVNKTLVDTLSLMKTKKARMKNDV